MNTIKQSVILIMIMATMFLFVGCSKDQANVNTIISPDDVTSSTADWMIIAGNWTDTSGKSSQSITVIPTNLVDYLDYSLVLKIDDVQLPLAHDNQIPVWSGTAELEPGQVYQFHIYTTNNLNNVTQEYTASAKMVFPVEVDFPTFYQSDTATPISWSLAQDSQYQEVYVTSTSITNHIAEYEKQISSNLRSYILPANCVPNQGTGSILTMQVNEFSYAHSGRLALFTASSSSRNYNVLKNQSVGKNDTVMQFAERMRKKLLAASL